MKSVDSRPAAAIVTDFLNALERSDFDGATALLDDSVVYENVGMPVDHGKEATIATLKRFMILADRFQVIMHGIAESNGMVLTERTDILSGPGLHLEFWVCGRFEVKDGKITLWKDYFDWATLSGQLAKSLPGIGSALVKSVFQR
jgi:limonene-1,2-epoxide hydrolase